MCQLALGSVNVLLCTQAVSPVRIGNCVKFRNFLAQNFRSQMHWPRAWTQPRNPTGIPWSQFQQVVWTTLCTTPPFILPLPWTPVLLRPHQTLKLPQAQKLPQLLCQAHYRLALYHSKPMGSTSVKWPSVPSPACGRSPKVKVPPITGLLILNHFPPSLSHEPKP